ncbi:MAG: pyridoxamine 5'-phosphate oxidase family protein [Candidatus Omnitrophica bacterium]|nr:pyridoxamine 5'-phosphate oxidase family protein [Candidatus Omnitrophota bacterium]
MDFKKYFEAKKGLGILSTSDKKGKVNAAVYSKPQVIDDKHFAFIMGDKLTHANLKDNPWAVFLFKEDGPDYQGKRVYLKKESETDNQELISRTCKSVYPETYCQTQYLKNSFLVTFVVESVLPLVGE